MARKITDANQLVTIRIPRDHINGRDSRTVIVNGKVFLIKRGTDVQVPQYVAEALKNSDRQGDIAYQYVKESRSVK